MQVTIPKETRAVIVTSLARALAAAWRRQQADLEAPVAPSVIQKNESRVPAREACARPDHHPAGFSGEATCTRE
jgi:hypothetical protein